MMVTVDGMYLGINEINEQGSLIIIYNVLFLELDDG